MSIRITTSTLHRRVGAMIGAAAIGATAITAGLPATSLAQGPVMGPPGPVKQYIVCPDPDKPVEQMSLDDAETAVLCLTNEKRRAHGLPPLAYNATLARSARTHAVRSAWQRWWKLDDNGAASHNDPGIDDDPNTSPPNDIVGRIKGRGGYCPPMGGMQPLWRVAENTYTGGGQQTPRSAVDWWYSHPGPDGTVATNVHRANMLSLEFRELGVGQTDGSAVMRDKNGKVIRGGGTFVQHFGRCG